MDGKPEHATSAMTETYHRCAAVDWEKFRQAANTIRSENLENIPKRIPVCALWSCSEVIILWWQSMSIVVQSSKHYCALGIIVTSYAIGLASTFPFQNYDIKPTGHGRDKLVMQEVMSY